MTDPTPLSPATKAVLRVANTNPKDEHAGLPQRQAIAAALRAAADQAQASVHHTSPSNTWAGPSNAWGRGWEEGVRDVAKGLLAIAAELDGTNHTGENV